MKAGVDVLLNGVQSNELCVSYHGGLFTIQCILKKSAADDNKERRETVRRKTSEYLIYAENLQKKIVGAKGPAVNQVIYSSQ